MAETSRKYEHSSFSSLVQSLRPKDTLLRMYCAVIAKNKDDDQTAQMRILSCTFTVRRLQSQVFSRRVQVN